MQKNTVNNIEESEPEKINKLLKIDFAEVKKKKQNKTKTVTRHDERLRLRLLLL